MTPLTTALLVLAVVAGPTLAGLVIAGTLRARERRQRVLDLLLPFLGEPMASTRRAAWAFLEAEGDAVHHFSHYVRTDPAYGDPSQRPGVVELLRVLLWLRTVADLRDAGELDPGLSEQLLVPHLRAWTGYTTRIAGRSAAHPDGVARGDAGLFSWRLAG
jgi:hypothetical protein